MLYLCSAVLPRVPGSILLGFQVLFLPRILNFNLKSSKVIRSETNAGQINPWVYMSKYLWRSSRDWIPGCACTRMRFPIRGRVK
jgi:hypothetical protein